MVERAGTYALVVEHALFDTLCVEVRDALREFGDIGRDWRVGLVELIRSTPRTVAAGPVGSLVNPNWRLRDAGVRPV
jgi:hypothetical protein